MGKTISVYLTTENLELMDGLGRLWGANRSQVVKMLLTTMETWARVGRALKYSGKVTIETNIEETPGAEN